MFTNFGLLDFSTADLIIILVILLLLFGGRKLPELSKSIGDSIKELRKGIGSETDNEKTKNKNDSDNSQNS